MPTHTGWGYQLSGAVLGDGSHPAVYLQHTLFAGQLAQPGNFVLWLVAGLVFDLGTDIRIVQRLNGMCVVVLVCSATYADVEGTQAGVAKWRLRLVLDIALHTHTCLGNASALSLWLGKYLHRAFWGLGLSGRWGC